MFARSLIIMLRLPVGSDMDDRFNDRQHIPLDVCRWTFSCNEGYSPRKMRMSPGVGGHRNLSASSHPVSSVIPSPCRGNLSPHCMFSGAVRHRFAVPTAHLKGHE